MNPFQENSNGHNIKKTGEIYKCTNCGKTATAKDRFARTECKSGDGEAPGL